MRGWYLNPGDEDHRGCRGGVGSRHRDGSYDLEIGQSCNASNDMIALCVMADEVLTYLKNSDCPIGQLLYDTHRQLLCQIELHYRSAINERVRKEMEAAQ